jgi:uncharacterized membrane protein YoaK (UPF0700 family)
MAGVLRDERMATAILSWVAGYVDTAGFLRLNGLFTAHVTGNLVVAGAELAGAEFAGPRAEDVWVRLAVIPVFVAAVVMTSVIARTRSVSLSNLLWLEVVTLLIFTAVGVAVIPQTEQSVDTSAMFMVGATGVFAMGVRNALMREALGTLAPTTVMTGNFTQLVIDSTRLGLIHDYDRDNHSGTQAREIRQRIGKFGSALVGFMIGAAFGAFFMRLVGFWSILLPAIATAVLALDTRRHERVLTQR